MNSLIGRITTDGRVTEFPRPGPISDGEAFGPDGNLWFTEGLQEKTTGTPLSNYSLSRITPAGQIIDLSLTGPAPFNADLTFGPDGNAWFTDTDGNAIGRITLSGLVAEFSIPTADTGPFGIVTGPDGNLWFNEFKAANIGRFGVATTDLGLAIPAPPVTGIAGQPLAYTISVTTMAQSRRPTWFSRRSSHPLRSPLFRRAIRGLVIPRAKGPSKTCRAVASSPRWVTWRAERQPR